ncbi:MULTISPECIES: acyl carrier protein [Pseudomonas]|jgi:acyl carrier protein|uniref:acyl carrier protein n=1 Tax=Pseudomonas TaxID=286 RepID=UPI000BC8F68C|nr:MULTISPECIES: acyl carrier protein [Pseudomonas]PCR93357.1 acyl carrier protein [Pseudomonas fluorescens]PMX00598.1 acyl carrier protein [Pseudomonas sp. FW215-R2]PMX06716.1 acyl carrier protein [Pseudomonas sp. FW215-L1]PMX18858.1 acyl carrier protein [Pseudomonas sp. FW215-E1]PNA23739.1 acyl carrier protein [Pseudomonas sp. FW215-R4]
MAVLEAMRASIAEILTLPLDELKGDVRLENSDNWDSMARIGIVALVFESTGVTVSGEEMDRIVTVQDIFDLVTLKMKETA